MCYVCGKSSNKIIHTTQCRYVKMIPERNKRYFKKLQDAYDRGYVCCKYCTSMYRYLRKEEKQLRTYCNQNGLVYSFNSADGAIDVVSMSGKWKIIVNGQKYYIWLYHKNCGSFDKGGLVAGYHSQKSC